MTQETLAPTVAGATNGRNDEDDNRLLRANNTTRNRFEELDAKIEQRAAEVAVPAVPDEPPSDLTEPDTRPAENTDLGNALRLAREYGQDARHVTGWGWLTWDGARWIRDDKPVYNMAKETALNIYGEVAKHDEAAKRYVDGAQRAAMAGDSEKETTLNNKAKISRGKAASTAAWAKDSQSAARIAAMIKLAESEPTVTARVDQFDADQWLLNCANGTVDLRTGTLSPHRRQDLLTKLAPVTYDPDATCPTWEAFLSRIMGGNVELIDFLQRAVGYSLTGSVVEQALLFLYGNGANGKSTFLKAILSMLGKDYAKQAAPELLTLSGGDRHPTELADLAGVRFVASVEVTEGRRMAETLVKQLTGGDPVKARLMRQDFFEYDPTFKIWLAANHKPIIKGTDDGIWRRIKLVPFTVTIPEAERDQHLGEKLEAEYPGILAWAVRGCLRWQREGLKYPQAVKEATNTYRAESDALAAFLADRTVTGADKQVSAGDAYKAYQEWAVANGLAPRDILSNVMFSRSMDERGFDSYKDNRTRQKLYIGLGLLQ